VLEMREGLDIITYLYEFNEGTMNENNKFYSERGMKLLKSWRKELHEEFRVRRQKITWFIEKVRPRRSHLDLRKIVGLNQATIM